MVTGSEFESLETNQRHLAVVGGHRPAPRSSGSQLRPVERAVIYPKVQGIMTAGRLIRFDTKKKEIPAGLRDTEPVFSRILPGRAAQVEAFLLLLVLQLDLQVQHL